MAGLVLGVESIPDGLASGLLAGVNPVAGLYGYLYGMIGGALFTSTAFMTVQATGAMSIIVADVDLASRDDPARSLFTLTILTGVVINAPTQPVMLTTSAPRNAAQKFTMSKPGKPVPT